MKVSQRGRVVHVKRLPYDVYVGRAMPGLAGSPFGNPYKSGRDGDLATVLARYREHVLGRPDLLAQLPSLAGKVLACWCTQGSLTADDRPYVCHGQVLLELIEGGAGHRGLASETSTSTGSSLPK